MQKKPPPTADAAELRRRAEERLREQHLGAGPDRAEADTQRLLHELQVHQIELELQNDELQHARNEIEAGLEKYSDLYEFAPVGYLTLDREGTIQEANLTATSLLGCERARLLKRRFGTFLAAPSLPVYNAFLQQVFAGKARECCEVKLLKNGNSPVAIRLEAEMAVTGRECRTVMEDITEQQRAEADRLILSKLESTGILAGGIAHDFNNLLTVILLNLEMAQILAPPGKELASHLEAAKQAALTTRGLTQQLITFAQGGAPLRKPTCLSGVIPESARAALSGSKVRSEFALADDLWRAEVDAAQLGQVIRNLVLNAREAMPTGGVVTIRAENVVLGPHEKPSLPPGDYVRVSIADHGGGMAKETLPKIFDPYFSTKQRGTQKGMGLGLTICHSVIQKHGGAIAVESEVGLGTTFFIDLPVSQKLPEKENAAVPATLPRPGRILVMDDDEGVRDVIGTTLRRLGLEVELVEEGQSAIEAYRNAQRLERPFDAVMLDLTVRAGIGGQETIQSLLKIDPNVKAIVMSGYAADPVIMEPEGHGFAGGLAKPFDSDKLREILARVLGAMSSGQ